jgi:hypothetical protein
MQVTVELPDQLATRLGENQERVIEIIEAGLRFREWPGASGLATEVIDFLASGPAPRKIVDFHPSKLSVERMRDLLDREEEGKLTAAEKAELDEMALLDHLMSLVKARAWEQAQAA